MELSLKPAKILFFVDGFAPTPDDIKAAGAINGQVCFRNARAITAEGSIEECDGVAGKVPPTYSKLPTAEEAVAKREAAIAALAAKVGDSPAPVVPPSLPPAPQGDADPAKGADAAQQDAAGAGDATAKADASAKAPAAPAGAAGAAWGSSR